jgi:hypothetical protein
MRLRLSELALANLEEIHDFTLNRWGEEQATHYLGMLWKRSKWTQPAGVCVLTFTKKPVFECAADT